MSSTAIEKAKEVERKREGGRERKVNIVKYVGRLD